MALSHPRTHPRSGPQAPSGAQARSGTQSRPTAHNPHLPDDGLSVPGGATPLPGRTPPAESGVSSLDAPEREPLSRGWASMPIIVILVVVGIFAAGALGMAIELML